VLAAYYETSGRSAEAIAEYEQLLAADRIDPAGLNNLAWMLHARGDARAVTLAKRAYDAAVRHFTNGEMNLKELIEVIDRTILPEFTAAQARIKRLDRVPYAQAPLLAGANDYLKLREESWRARSAGLRRKSLGTMRPPDETERASLEVLDRIRPAVPVAAQ